MNIAVVYDSETGTTAQAAERMGDLLSAQGHRCRVESIAQADGQEERHGLPPDPGDRRQRPFNRLGHR